MSPGGGATITSPAPSSGLSSAPATRRVFTSCPDWGSATAARDDVAIHLFGLKEAPTRRAQVNILWQISHPDRASPELYERYDHVFVASDLFAARMAEPRRRAGEPAPPGDRSRSDSDPSPAGRITSCCSWPTRARCHRRIVDDLAGTDHDLAIYGANWTPELVDPRFVKADGIPNAELGALLQRCRYRAQRPLGRHACRGVHLEPPL